ncbi:MAG: DUF3467 domain-containing protein [Planctomycetota bacterium]
MAKSDAETPKAAPEGAQQQAQQQIEVDDSGVVTQYANFFAATGTMEEVILDFGNRGKSPQDKIKIDSRVVVSVFNAKRILAALAQTINMYEERFGKIELDPRKRMQTPVS